MSNLKTISFSLYWSKLRDVYMRPEVNLNRFEISNRFENSFRLQGNFTAANFEISNRFQKLFFIHYSYIHSKTYFHLKTLFSFNNFSVCIYRHGRTVK